jgi:putative DNA primase/helicase
LTVQGHPASATDPKTWSSFDEVMVAYREPTLALNGIGYVVTGDGLVGIDFDHCRDPLHGGVIDPDVLQLLLELNTYTEPSPSGTGVRAFCYGILPSGGRRKGPFELYDRGRYFTLTGRHVDGFPATIMRRPVELVNIHTAIFGSPSSNGQPAPTPRTSAPVTDQTLIARAMAAKNGDLFRKLWVGDFNDYPSPSEADLALCGLLAFWCGRDAEWMDALFRQSGLMRPKWDERRGAATYGERTLAAAIAEGHEVYTARTKMTKAKTFKSAPTPVEDLTSDIEDPPEPDPQDDEPARHVAADHDDDHQYGAEGGVPAAPAVHLALPPGFVQRYVEVAMRRTDAPAEAHTLTAVTVMSALAGPTPRLNLAHLRAGLRLLMWSMNLVDSTSGRKTTVNDFGSEAISVALGEEAILPWKGSPEAFIQLMAARDGQTCVMTRDEYVGLLVGMKQGGYMAGLAQDFIRMWDGAPLGMGRTAKMNRNTGQRVNDSDVIRNPFLVQLTAATRSRFIEVATIEDILDGFLARFTFTSGSAEEQRMKHKDSVIETAWQQVLLLAKDYHERAKHVLTVEVTDEILDLEWELEKRFKAQALAQARPDVAAPAMKRLAESVFKTAGLLALDDSCQGAATISPGHFESAVALSHRWQATTLALVDDIGRTRFQADCDSVLATIRTHRKLSIRDLYRVHRRLRNRDFDEILAALEAQGAITREEDKTGKKGWSPAMVSYVGRGSRA